MVALRELVLRNVVGVDMVGSLQDILQDALTNDFAGFIIKENDVNILRCTGNRSRGNIAASAIAAAITELADPYS